MSKTPSHATLVGLLWLAWLCTPVAAGGSPETLAADVRAAEQAFARTMADRDLEAFKTFLSDEAIFLSGDQADRGSQAVAERWAAYYEGAEAPFSWSPETVVVLESGRLALSTGPVFNTAGERVATFTSTWRLEADGNWRVVFDRGNRYCEEP